MTQQEQKWRQSFMNVFNNGTDNGELAKNTKAKLEIKEFYQLRELLKNKRVKGKKRSVMYERRR